MGDEPEHNITTRRSNHRYTFIGKHHGGGSPTDGRWLKSISRDEEFAVFDTADWHEVADEDRWLYGVWQTDGELRDLGTDYQQVAAFPFADAGQPWHGYPCWPLLSDESRNRQSEKMRPPKLAFANLEQEGLITRQQRKRLMKGKHA